MKKTYKLIAGLDIGNGYVKGSIEGNDMAAVDMPSGVAFVTSTHDIKTPMSEADEVIANIYNTMDVSFTTPLVRDTYRRLFGSRGVTSGSSLEEFDVYSHISKANQPLSSILVLGCLAGKTLQEYWNAYHELPTDVLHANVSVCLALPIGEYKKYRKDYANNFRKSVHMVTFHNFDQTVNVEIAFDDVQVVAEGAAAQYAITAKGEPLMNSMLADCRKMGNALEGITAADVLAAENTVGVDIGEGTVNFPVFQNGRFNPDASITFDKGYGSVMNAALSRLQDMGFSYNSRKELVEFLQKRPSKLNELRYKQVQTIVDEEIISFVREVNLQFSRVMSTVGSYIEVVYVYGGGATSVRPELYPALMETSKAFGGGIMTYPILYLDSRYSRYLNREGLFVIEEKVVKSNK